MKVEAIKWHVLDEYQTTECWSFLGHGRCSTDSQRSRCQCHLTVESLPLSGRSECGKVCTTHVSLAYLKSPKPNFWSLGTCLQQCMLPSFPVSMEKCVYYTNQTVFQRISTNKEINSTLSKNTKPTSQ